MRLHQMIIPYLDVPSSAVSDGMDWVRIERITSMIAREGADQQVDGLTPFGLIAHKTTKSGLFLREIIKAFTQAGAPLFGDDRAFEHFIANPAFGPDDLGALLMEIAKPGGPGHQSNERGENIMHLLARLHPQLLGEMENYGFGPGREKLEQLFQRVDHEGNLPLHRLLEAGGCIAAKPHFQYPGEQLYMAIAWAANDEAFWQLRNHAGQTPLGLLADRIAEHPGNQKYTQALAGGLGPIVDQAIAEIGRRQLDQATGPAAKGRIGVRL